MANNAPEQRAIREWLRSERRLGVTHWAVPATVAAPATPPQRAPAARSPATEGAAPQSAIARPAATAARTAAQAPLPIADAPDLPPICNDELSADEVRSRFAALNDGFVRGCTRCTLHTGRTQTVFGVGDVRARLVFVGEGPGADEDRVGEPFVGRAGQLLTRMIAAMTLTREQVYICNVVKCRPPENRTPLDDEMRACSPFLFRQLALIRPEIIVTLGRPATQTLLCTNEPIGRLRGQFHDFPPTPLAHLGLPRARLMPTFHPAYLLRSPGEKGKAWEDLKQVMQAFGLAVPRRESSE